MKKSTSLLCTLTIFIGSSELLKAQITSYDQNSANRIGEFSVYLGYQSGINETNTRPTYNTFVGYQSGLKNSWGSSNVFIGASSGKENTTGRHRIPMLEQVVALEVLQQDIILF